MSRRFIKTEEYLLSALRNPETLRAFTEETYALAKEEARREILNGPVFALAEAVTMYLGGSKLKPKADQRIDMLKALAAVDREIQATKAMIERENAE